MRSLLPAIAAALLLGACGPQPLPFEREVPQALVEAPGDQIHPQLQGQRLVWFDLSTDPDGRCHVPQSGPDYDATCNGVVRGMDLRSGVARSLSGLLSEEVRPRLAGDRVVWRCTQDGQPGMCSTPFARAEPTFHPQMGWTHYYYYPDERNLAVGDGYLVWAEYAAWDWTWVWRLVWADLDSDTEQELVQLDQVPAELVEDDGRVTWSMQRWTELGYRFQVETYDLETHQRELLFEDERPRAGLAAADGLLAWQETDADGKVHVFARDRDGAGTRVESQAAMVSSQLRLGLAGRRVVWLDHRTGDYRIVAADLDARTETFVTPPEAVVGVAIAPAVSDEAVVWADLRGGDWDLYLFRF